MFEDKRRCISCGRIPAWTEVVVNCSDQKRICVDCIRKANLPDPPANATGQVHPWASTDFLKRIEAHQKYDEFCRKPGTQKLVEGNLLINENDKLFAVGSNDYDKTLIGFQSASYSQIESISINDGVQTKSVKVSDGDSGAAGALFGGLVFGPLGAIVGGLGTRTESEYGEITQTNNIGFTVTYKNTSHDNFNVLKLCLNYNFVNYDTQRDIYEQAKQITVNICEEILKRVQQIHQTEAKQTEQYQRAGAMPAAANVNINPNNVEPTITRIELFLEDGEWDNARAYAHAALDYFPTDYRLYLFLLFDELKVSSLEQLAKCDSSFKDSSYYKKAKRFADPETADKLESLSAAAEKNDYYASVYNNAKQRMQKGAYEEAYNLFSTISNYKDSSEQMTECAANMTEAVRLAEKKKADAEKLENKVNDSISKVDNLLSERDELMQKLSTDSNDESLFDRVKKIDFELLSYAGIKQKTGNTLEFEGFYVKPEKMAMSNQEWKPFLSNNEWEIISRQGNYVLLLSKYCEMKSIMPTRLNMNDLYEWKISNVRDALDAGSRGSTGTGTLLYEPLINAFRKAHKQLFISPKDVYGDNSPSEAMYILSKKEVERYLPTLEMRKLFDKDNLSTTLPWLLRSDVPTKMADVIDATGNFTTAKIRTLMHGNYKDAALRPAVWIDISRVKEIVGINAKIDSSNEDNKADTLLKDGNLYRCFGYSLLTPKRFSESVAIGNMQYMIKSSEQKSTLLIFNSPQECKSEDEAVNNIDQMSTTLINRAGRKLIEKQKIETPIGSGYLFKVDDDSAGKKMIQSWLYDDINNNMMGITLSYINGTEDELIGDEYISVLKSIKVL